VRPGLVATLVLLVAESVAAQDAPPLRLSMSGAFRPFSTTDDEGRLVGFDADVAREVAHRLDRWPVLIQTDWAGIQAGLQSGKVDLICGSMAITAARLETMYFTLPYYVSGAQVFARKGLADLRGARIGVTEDSTYERYIAGHPQEFPEATVVRYGSEAEIVAAMNADKIDAFVSDRIVGGFYVSRGAAGAIEPRGPLLYREACGIAARKDSAALVVRVDGALAGMVLDGTYARIYRRWVGREPDLEVLLASWAEHVRFVPRIEGGPGEEAQPEFAESAGSMLALLGQGALLTLQLGLITAVLALLTGSIVGVGAVARSSFLAGISNGFIWLVRGTPLLVQLFLSYFVLATLVNRAVGFEAIGAFGAALIALVVNTTAYNAETLRGGILAVDRGQWDAAASLGMTRGRILRRTILPQAFLGSLPSLGNNLVVLIKDTSLVGAITLIELTYAARNVVFQTGRAFVPFLLAAAFYLTIITLLAVGLKALERWLRRSRQAVGKSI
jgi:His/Glu/Gln/Arg/opine family amino acid ABC transporter permease subunit